MKRLIFILTFTLATAVASSLLLSSASYANDERDPTRPPRHAIAVGDGITEVITYEVKMITTVSGKRVALVNDEHLRLGDYIDDWRVGRIDRNRVTLRRGNEVLVLSVFGELRKTEVRDNG